jgi:hypothetical protein
MEKGLGAVEGVEATLELTIPPGIPGSPIRWRGWVPDIFLFDIDFEIRRAYGLLHSRLANSSTAKNTANRRRPENRNTIPMPCCQLHLFVSPHNR